MPPKANKKAAVTKAPAIQELPPAGYDPNTH